MSKVSVTKDKLDILANAIANKSGEPLTLTLDEMVSAVDGIQVGGGGITPTGNIDITQAGVTDVTNYATATVPSAEPFAGIQVGGFYTENNVYKWRFRATTEVNEGEGDKAGYLPDGTYKAGEWYVYNAVPNYTTVTPTTSAQTIGGVNYMMAGAVTVSAMPTGTATAPTTISGTAATVSTGTNTLTLSKTVSNTPRITTAGYIASGTAGNSSVSLTANVTTKGTATITPTTSNQTIASGTYLTGTQTISGDANLVAGNIKSGTTIFGVTGTYAGGGGTSKNAQVVQGTTRTTSSTLTAIGAEMTVSKTGTYDVYWSAFRSNTSTQYTFATKLYINGTGYGSEQTTWSNHQQNVHLSNVSLTLNDKIRVYGRESRNSSYYMYAGTLTIVEA